MAGLAAVGFGWRLIGLVVEGDGVNAGRPAPVFIGSAASRPMAKCQIA